MSVIDRVLLFGATGYIGGTVLDHLIATQEPAIKALTFDLLIHNNTAAERFRRA